MVVKVIPKFKTCGFTHENPEVFVMSQWQNKPKSIIYLMYRWVFAIFFIFVLCYSMISSVEDDSINYWFIYLTNIGLLICTIYSVYAAIFVSIVHFGIISLESNSFSYKVFWFLSNISIVLALLISIVYWATLYDWSKGLLTVLDFLIHAMNSVAMLIDLFIVLHPMYFFHVIYSLGVGLLYLIFSIIYYVSGGTDINGNDYIYSILNWNKAGQTTGIVFAVIALAIILHCVAVGLHFGRAKLHRVATKGRQQSFEVNKPDV
ncbi:hypothetical protein PVAND_000392 [Polypedilum vanderplanki]|uniref:Protein rolling stone n=1 Tax=Polypedilum vanderplanki TaxID=319348 RepID=A0A9J6BJY9_POLVA|nr:hypothetical protein PVAND_000392 [Polypedilum vanderplanki]